ncbi:hypothetical protein E4U19_007606 [Claviceps sp. Clav32 group G5]|nr:hypothetical protein E4U19_007606 [Claviceps sp. Clav32 group G5]
MCPASRASARASSRRPATRASARRAASQPALPTPQQTQQFALPSFEQPYFSRATETPSSQDQGTPTQTDSTLTLFLQSLSTQVSTLTSSLQGLQDENSTLRKLVLSSQTRQDNTASHAGKSSLFTKPTRFSGKDLANFRAWWATVISSAWKALTNPQQTGLQQQRPLWMPTVPPFLRSIRNGSQL